MAEKNIFNKELGINQTQEEYDAWRKQKAEEMANWTAEYYGDQANKWNEFGSDLGFETYLRDPGEFGFQSTSYRGPLYSIFYDEDGKYNYDS